MSTQLHVWCVCKLLQPLVLRQTLLLTLVLLLLSCHLLCRPQHVCSVRSYWHHVFPRAELSSTMATCEACKAACLDPVNKCGISQCCPNCNKVGVLRAATNMFLAPFLACCEKQG